MNLSTKQKQTHRRGEQTHGCQGEGGRIRRLRVWDPQVQAIIYRLDKQ